MDPVRHKLRHKLFSGVEASPKGWPSTEMGPRMGLSLTRPTLPAPGGRSRVREG